MKIKTYNLEEKFKQGRKRKESNILKRTKVCSEYDFG